LERNSGPNGCRCLVMRLQFGPNQSGPIALNFGVSKPDRDRAFEIVNASCLARRDFGIVRDVAII
jgi:hypothetical protein